MYGVQNGLASRVRQTGRNLRPADAQKEKRIERESFTVCAGAVRPPLAVERLHRKASSIGRLHLVVILRPVSSSCRVRSDNVNRALLYSELVCELPENNVKRDDESQAACRAARRAWNMASRPQTLRTWCKCDARRRRRTTSRRSESCLTMNQSRGGVLQGESGRVAERDGESLRRNRSDVSPDALTRRK
jgi:hypothetical protein